MRDLNERLEKFMEDWGYDAWLDRQADEYNDPHTSEVTIKGHSCFDIKAKKPDGEIVEMKKIPLEVYCTIDVTDEDEISGRTYTPRWSDIADDIEDRFDVNDLENYDTYVEDVECELLPEDWELVEVQGFSDGYGFDNLEIE